MRGPTTTDARTPAFAANVQAMHPVAASREYTLPFCLPTHTRPPATVGCAHADAVSGNPNAHCSCRCGTRSIVRPAAAADWKCELSIDALHPVQPGPADGSRSG